MFGKGLKGEGLPIIWGSNPNGKWLVWALGRHAQGAGDGDGYDNNCNLLLKTSIIKKIETL